MFKFDREIIRKRRIDKRMSLRELVQITKNIDPRGKGVSITTCQRAENPEGNILLESYLLICEALELSPRSPLKRIE